MKFMDKIEEYQGLRERLQKNLTWLRNNPGPDVAAELSELRDKQADEVGEMNARHKAEEVKLQKDLAKRAAAHSQMEKELRRLRTQMIEAAREITLLLNSDIAGVTGGIQDEP